MATYTFNPVPAWGAVGQFARIGAQKSSTFPCTLPGGGNATVVQGGVTKVGYVESDDTGFIAGFTTTDIPSVVVDFGIGKLTINSLEAISAGASSAAAAANSATNAATSASNAATSASNAAATVSSKVSKGDLVVNARDYGVVGDGTTDDTTAMQNALNAAGVGGRVIIPRGAGLNTVVRCNSGLTMLAYQTIDGGSFHLGSYLAGTTEPSTAEITFPALTGAAVGITMGDCCRIENLLIRGPGSGVGTCTGVVNRSAGTSGPSHSARFFNTSIVEWATCVSLTNCYYGEFIGCEFALLGTGLALSGCNNITLYNPRFLCRAIESGGAGGIAIDTGAISALSIFGGSIEDFGASGGIKYASNANVNAYGVYWESFVTGAFGLRPATTTSAVTLNLSGCYVALNNLNRWVFFDTANSVLESHGNRFTSTSGSTTTPIGYVLGTATTNDANVTGDSWQGTAVGSYADGASVGVAGLNVQWPTQVATHGVKAYRGRKQQMPASSATIASVRLPHGVAPTTPEDGDMWTTTAGLFVRVNGVTKTVTLT